MRFNERQILYLAKTRDNVSKKSYLCKRGAINTDFKKRFFVLKWNLLFYFKDKSDWETGHDPIGVIVLERCSVESMWSGKNADDLSCAFSLTFDSPGARDYCLACKDHTLMMEWMKAIQSSSCHSMRGQVSKLEQRLATLQQQLLVPMALQPTPEAPIRRRHSTEDSTSNQDNRSWTVGARADTVSGGCKNDSSPRSASVVTSPQGRPNTATPLLPPSSSSPPDNPPIPPRRTSSLSSYTAATSNTTQGEQEETIAMDPIRPLSTRNSTGKLSRTPGQ